MQTTLPNTLLLIPEHVREPLHAYVETGRPVGSFLRSLLEGAPWYVVIRNADDTNRAELARFLHYLWNDAPVACWGSPEAVQAWMERGGRQGREAA